MTRGHAPMWSYCHLQVVLFTSYKNALCLNTQKDTPTELLAVVFAWLPFNPLIPCSSGSSLATLNWVLLQLFPYIIKYLNKRSGGLIPFKRFIYMTPNIHREGKHLNAEHCVDKTSAWSTQFMFLLDVWVPEKYSHRPASPLQRASSWLPKVWGSNSSGSERWKQH